MSKGRLGGDVLELSRRRILPQPIVHAQDRKPELAPRRNTRAAACSDESALFAGSKDEPRMWSVALARIIMGTSGPTPRSRRTT